ncbi:membrane protein insertion efficiency factor YidD [Corynebacterium heidelbergense]|uniref:Putative membrane protein insertion efficiency factor n=1 Tax=Corynebacterium heidelbergense TaxID=2055947 RepID=A0A364VD34_9CORY|nr:membrane protein insertion efficiency factor YidD [Corynebacterium heidelbergense]RAV34540.1 membrane protein insertion efficiency factor YidD [Corynebacterium heidelbergense]
MKPEPEKTVEHGDDRSPLARRCIGFYRAYLSSMKAGPSCRFEPTCSEYALTAFGRFGPIKGFALSAARLARCGPWHPGGWDPVPPRRPGLWQRLLAGRAEGSSR